MSASADVLAVARHELALLRKDATSRYVAPRELWRLAYWAARARVGGAA